MRNLDPFLDLEGILRAGGRLQLASFPYGMMYPIILPSDSYVMTLIIRYFHEKTKHQSRGITLNEVRASGYWILGGSTAVGSYIAKCIVCRKLCGTTQQQKMTDLLEDRLETAPPFTSRAVDYFGPWMFKEGRREVKKYGVIFTRLASRAVHLETSST